MGLVKTRRLAAMQKQQRAILLRHPPTLKLRRTGGFHLRRGYGGRVGGLKAGMQPTPTRGNGTWPQPSHLYKSVGKVFDGARRPTAKFTVCKP